MGAAGYGDTALAMSRDEFVRQPLKPRERASRTVDQRLALRFPGVASAAARLLSGLSPKSRLRQAILARNVQLAAAAYNRRDLDAVVIGYDPEFEYLPARRWAESGLIDECYRGLEGYRSTSRPPPRSSGLRFASTRWR